MKKLFSISIFLIVLLTLSFFANETKVIKLKNTRFQLEIVDNNIGRYKGLSNRNYLCGNCAMLFVFKDSKPRNFVMREMMMPIDILFIENGVIIDIHKNLEPEGKDYNKNYYSSSKANMALEINANLTDKYKIKVGDKIKINY
jgi:uncharacterized membrane protein (UPF0127 family)